MLIRVFRPLYTQRLYRARKSAVAAVVVAVVAAGGGGLGGFLFSDNISPRRRVGDLEELRDELRALSCGPSRQTGSNHSPGERGGGAVRGQTRDGR
jgi:hypothetical protein